MAKSKKTKLSIKQRAISLFTQKLSHVGMSFGVYFMVLSLTPSLMPRTWLFQGLVSGLSLISGYAFGTGLMWIWRFLHVRELNGDVKLYVSRAVHIFNALLFLYIMAKVGDWQNRVRELVGVEPSSTTNPFRIVFIAVVTASILLILARIIRVSTSKVIRFTERYVPRRVATIVGILIAFWFFGTVVSGAFQSTALRLANNTFSLADRSTKDGSFVPSSSLRSAGPESIVQWDDLGKQGREFVGRGPTADDISAVADGAIDPIRVYAGLANGETHEERSAVVLQELIRTNAFDRSKMVIATSTGTGYLDPGAVDTFEYVNGGDTAIASQQYSYLPSWLALLTDTETAKDAGISLFNAVHGHWQNLDEDSRPDLYLYGLSLGAYGSQASISRVELLNDPVDGALWAGPPFVSEFWNRVTDDRDEGSPSWLPEYQNGRVIRFTGDENNLYDQTEEWQENKIIYMQYATDPVVFFSTDYLFNEPEWLQGDLGPGVSEDMRWYPVVTFWQLAFDLAGAAGADVGFGHLYSPEAYIDSWVALTEPTNWTDQKTETLKEIF